MGSCVRVCDFVAVETARLSGVLGWGVGRGAEVGRHDVRLGGCVILPMVRGGNIGRSAAPYQASPRGRGRGDLQGT